MLAQLQLEISQLADAIMARERVILQLDYELERERELLAEMRAKLGYMMDWEARAANVLSMPVLRRLESHG